MPGARMNSPLARCARSARAFTLVVMCLPSSEVFQAELDVADADLVAGMDHGRRAGLDVGSVDRGAVGRTLVLDLQRLAREHQPHVTARHGSVRQHKFALVGGAADHHALWQLHQLVERHVEGELLTGRVRALEAQHDLRDDARRGLGGIVRRQRRRREVAHVEDMDRPAHVLELVLAAVDEGVVYLELGHVAHRARHRDAARLGGGLDAGGEIDAVTEDVLVFLVNDDFAQMHADAELHALRLVERLIEDRHPFLDIDRSGDGGDRRAELRQHRIARGPDQPATAGIDRRTPDLDLRGLEVTEGARLPALHHAGEAREVGVQDGGEATLGGGHGGQFSGQISVSRPSLRYLAAWLPTRPTGAIAGPAASRATYWRAWPRIVWSPGSAGRSTAKIACSGMVTTTNFRHGV